MGNTWAQESPKLQKQNQAHKLSKHTRATKDAGPSSHIGHRGTDEPVIHPSHCVKRLTGTRLRIFPWTLAPHGLYQSTDPLRWLSLRSRRNLGDLPELNLPPIFILAQLWRSPAGIQVSPWISYHAHMALTTSYWLSEIFASTKASLNTSSSLGCL